MSVVIAVLALTLMALAGLDLVESLLGGPVARHRVYDFAVRQGLTITPDNGGLVIRYLATTRRWRTLGLIGGVVLAGAWSVHQGGFQVSFLAAFAGWFVGAVVAEWRIVAADHGVRRAAVLTPRLVSDLVGRVPRSLPLLALGIAVVLALGSLAAAAAGRSVDVPAVMAWLVVAVAGLAVPAVVARHVLERRQAPDLAPDVFAADDAVRRRSSHVLLGSSLALIAYPTAGLIEHLPVGEDTAGLMSVVLVLPAVFAGWLVARTPARLQPHREPATLR